MKEKNDNTEALRATLLNLRSTLEIAESLTDDSINQIEETEQQLRLTRLELRVRTAERNYFITAFAIALMCLIALAAYAGGWNLVQELVQELIDAFKEPATLAGLDSAMIVVAASILAGFVSLWTIRKFIRLFV